MDENICTCVSMYVCLNVYGTRWSMTEFMYESVGIWQYRVCPHRPPPHILSLILVKREIGVEIELIEWINFAWFVWNLTFPLNNADVFPFVFQLYTGFSYYRVQSCTEWHKSLATPASVTRIFFFCFSGNMQWRNNSNNNNNNNNELNTDTDSKCRLCQQFDERVEHIISACPILEKTAVHKRYDSVCVCVCVHNYTSTYARKQGYNWTKNARMNMCQNQ